jgi:hypothetical protein
VPYKDPEKQKAWKKAWANAYRKTEIGKARVKAIQVRYESTDKGKAKHARYYDAHIEQIKIKKALPENKEANKWAAVKHRREKRFQENKI